MAPAAKAEPDGSRPGGLAPSDAGSAEFARLTDPFRAELLAHCYRMLGSVHDAEDQVQETLLRAWRSFGQFEGRASLRTWLYRIATNACLRAIETRGRRPLPSGLGAPGEYPEGPLAAAMPEVPWLQPMPDALLRPESADPAAVSAARTNIRLALIAAMQYLPPRQRARAQLQQAAPSEDEITEPADPGDLALLNRYATAFENADITALTGLLHDDAVLEMPPLPTWFAGQEHIGRFLQAHLLRQPGDFTMIPAAANGQPALAAYRRGQDGVYRANGIEVLTFTGPRIARIVVFLDAGLFASFGLAPALP